MTIYWEAPLNNTSRFFFLYIKAQNTDYNNTGVEFVSGVFVWSMMCDCLSRLFSTYMYVSVYCILLVFFDVMSLFVRDQVWPERVHARLCQTFREATPSLRNPHGTCAFCQWEISVPNKVSCDFTWSDWDKSGKNFIYIFIILYVEADMYFSMLSYCCTIN